MLSVTPAHAAERVIALSPHLAELVCEIGACDRLVGVVESTDAPPAAAAKTQIGSMYAVNLERVVALQPDWILAWDGGTSPAVGERLQKLGFRVSMIRIADLDGIAGAMQQIGRELGAEEGAAAAAVRYRARLAALRERYRERPRLSVFFQIETAPAYTINRFSPINEALALCGADNVFAQLPVIASAVGLEAVLAARPEVVVYSKQEDANAIHQYWRRFAQLPAARQQVAVNADLLTRQTPRMLDGIVELCEGLDRIRAAQSAARPSRDAS